MSYTLRLIKRRIRECLWGQPIVRHCPICGWKGRQFLPGGARDKLRYDALCPQCSSLERQRLAFLVAKECADLDYSRTLHVAPERLLADWLKDRSGEYVSIDIESRAMLQMDITDLQFEDGKWTLVWASHVMEHIEDDGKAISEIHRVLAPGGAAFVQVPMWKTLTFEDPEKRDPDSRRKLYHQADHVRLYGMDIVDRFESAGFSSTIYRAQDFGPDRLLTHGLSFASTDEVFVFRK